MYKKALITLNKRNVSKIVNVRKLENKNCFSHQESVKQIYILLRMFRIQTIYHCGRVRRNSVTTNYTRNSCYSSVGQCCRVTRVVHTKYLLQLLHNINLLLSLDRVTALDIVHG